MRTLFLPCQTKWVVTYPIDRGAKAETVEVKRKIAIETLIMVAGLVEVQDMS